MSTESETERSEATGASSGGPLSPNLASVLAYFFGLLGGIVIYLIQDDEHSRFHGMQSILFNVALGVIYVGIFVLGIILTVIDDALGIVTLLLYLLVFGIAFLTWAFLIYKGYSGEQYRLPVIGDMAASYA